MYAVQASLALPSSSSAALRTAVVNWNRNVSSAAAKIERSARKRSRRSSARALSSGLGAGGLTGSPALRSAAQSCWARDRFSANGLSWFARVRKTVPCWPAAFSERCCAKLARSFAASSSNIRCLLRSKGVGNRSTRAINGRYIPFHRFGPRGVAVGVFLKADATLV